MAREEIRRVNRETIIDVALNEMLHSMEATARVKSNNGRKWTGTRGIVFFMLDGFGFDGV